MTEQREFVGQDDVTLADTLARPILTQPFRVRVAVMHALGFEIACCPYCGCYINAPYCHDSDDVAASEHDDACPCPDSDENISEDATPC